MERNKGWNSAILESKARVSEFAKVELKMKMGVAKLFLSVARPGKKTVDIEDFANAIGVKPSTFTGWVRTYENAWVKLSPKDQKQCNSSVIQTTGQKVRNDSPASAVRAAFDHIKATKQDNAQGKETKANAVMSTGVVVKSLELLTESVNSLNPNPKQWQKMERAFKDLTLAFSSKSLKMKTNLRIAGSK